MSQEFDGLSGKTSLISQLIFKHLQETISEEELVTLNEWIQESVENRQLFETLIDKNILQGKWSQFYSGVKTQDDTWRRVVDGISPGRRVKFRWFSLAAASVILVVLMFGVYRWKQVQPMVVVESQEARFKNEVKAPDNNRAVLTLEDGRKIYLDSVDNGKLLSQSNVNIEKLADGQIAYKQQAAAAEIVYNTLSNPRGSRVIDVMLADGSRVWLNNESSIRFPVAFVGDERRVEVSGEAYFEVAHDAHKKFLVVSGGSSVEVLGTHFNVNSYSDLVTTLVEGSVRVRRGDDQVVLHPGQQTKVLGNKIELVADANVQDAIAWKNGLIVFDHTSIEEIFKQIERWYDVEISASGNLNVPEMIGGLPRSMSLTEVLKVLEENSKLIFKIQGKKVTATL